MLGISRGTLRLALERLSANGEIVRRQGSGTYVGRVAVPSAFSEGLEVLESYASLARRQGHQPYLTVTNKTTVYSKALCLDRNQTQRLRVEEYP